MPTGLHEGIWKDARAISAHHEPQNIAQSKPCLQQLCSSAESPVLNAHKEIHDSSYAVADMKPYWHPGRNLQPANKQAFHGASGSVIIAAETKYEMSSHTVM